MIDYAKSTATEASAMKTLGRLATNNGFGCKLTHQTTTARRFSCSNPLTVRFDNKVSIIEQPTATFAKRALQRLSASTITLNNGLNRPQSAAIKIERTAKRKLSSAGPEVKQSLIGLCKSLRDYIEDKAGLTKCHDVHICDGSQTEREWLLKLMAEEKMIKPLRKYENCWLARTDPRDVARVESKTFICTRNRIDVEPRGDENAQKGALGNWMDLGELDERMGKLLKGCMSGRTMFVIPFSMGPLNSELSKVGIQLTDSPYVVVSMLTMTRVSQQVLVRINQNENDYVRCFHSVGCPLPLKRPLVNHWPCNPDETIISHIPERKEIISYGSGYGGNSLLGKKCFALRLGSILGLQEGWLAEHMLILGVTNPSGAKKYIAAAFPSACGKTNLAMMTPSLPGYKVECVGDDIAWMRFDSNGQLRAINPEAGFFGVAPGTNEASNPNAMKTIERNTIFTNVAETSDGHFYWEGLEHLLSSEQQAEVIDWQGNRWRRDGPAAHPNSRFCAPADQCPIIDPEWESAQGVPISAIVFGGRRPEGVPLVYEALDWAHGVFVGASMRSESTAAAAEHRAKAIMNDPFAMRPFFGYNFGRYLEHWLSFGKSNGLKLPKIFHVNWFRKDPRSGRFLWPGFGENSRVLDWICRRIDGEPCARPTPIGLVPKRDAINLEGLSAEVNTEELFKISKHFWLEEQQSVERYLKSNVGLDLPSEIIEQSEGLKSRLEAYSEPELGPEREGRNE